MSENVLHEHSYLKKSLRLRRKNGRRGIREKCVGLWKNIKDTCKRARVFSEVLEMLEIEGSIPNRGIWGYVESFWVLAFHFMKGSGFDGT